MPGDSRINIRVTAEEADRLKKAAAALRMSLTAFMVRTTLHAAENVVAGSTGLVHISAPAQEVSEKVQQPPSRGQGVAGRPGLGQITPDTPIGEVSLDELKRWVRVEEEYARMQEDVEY